MWNSLYAYHEISKIVKYLSKRDVMFKSLDKEMSQDALKKETYPDTLYVVPFKMDLRLSGRAPARCSKETYPRQDASKTVSEVTHLLTGLGCPREQDEHIGYMENVLCLENGTYQSGLKSATQTISTLTQRKT
ncbi:hypothetical protein MAR_001569 [Mya arenaria]|uniref:Uncharacterized protein n=1 Tax=Mya arenaria TaxID=6604 RepID=A0ABY7FG65_MYAAR|nr:hypothetical protein MAR_001569 [Mya arenaria]